MPRGRQHRSRRGRQARPRDDEADKLKQDDHANLRIVEAIGGPTLENLVDLDATLQETAFLIASVEARLAEIDAHQYFDGNDETGAGESKPTNHRLLWADLTAGDSDYADGLEVLDMLRDTATHAEDEGRTVAEHCDCNDKDGLDMWYSGEVADPPVAACSAPPPGKEMMSPTAEEAEDCTAAVEAKQEEAADRVSSDLDAEVQLQLGDDIDMQPHWSGTVDHSVSPPGKEVLAQTAAKTEDCTAAVDAKEEVAAGEVSSNREYIPPWPGETKSEANCS